MCVIIICVWVIDDALRNAFIAANTVVQLFWLSSFEFVDLCANGIRLRLSLTHFSSNKVNSRPINYLNKSGQWVSNVTERTELSEQFIENLNFVRKYFSCRILNWKIYNLCWTLAGTCVKSKFINKKLRRTIFFFNFFNFFF